MGCGRREQDEQKKKLANKRMTTQRKKELNEDMTVD